MSQKVKSVRDIDQEIGNRLRQYRQLRGLSQTGLGEKLSRPITFQQIQKYEKGSNRVSVSTLIDLCKILDCHPNDIIGSYFEGSGTLNADLIQRMQKYEATMRDIQTIINKAGQ